MGIEDLPTDETALLEPVLVPTAVPWPTYLTGSLRFKFFLTGFVFPTICLVLIAIWDGNHSLRSPWQTGQLLDYVIVLTRPPTIYWFYPILAYSFVSLAFWCWKPHQYSRFLLVRLGLQTGILLALTFTILLMITTSIIGPIMALIVIPVLALAIWLIKRFAKRLTRFSILNLMFLTTIVAVLLALVGGSLKQEPRGLASSVAGFFTFSILFICGGAPTMGLVTFIRTSVTASYLAGPTNSTRIGQIGSWLTWLLSLGVTWKLAIETMLIEYAQLPTTDPNCYVSSAAAAGHPWLVRAKVSGKGRVNLQMKRCKFLEIVAKVCLPTGARHLRHLYNYLGPPLAELCRHNRFFADGTYLLLKPVEWLAWLLQRLFGVKNQLVDRIYEKS